MSLIEQYIRYIQNIKRYSDRTVNIYETVLKDFLRRTFATEDVSDQMLVEAMNHSELRSYEVALLDSSPKSHSPKTVSLHMSVLSGFCRFLMKEGYLKSNPAKLVSRPRIAKRIPEFYNDEAMSVYFDNTSAFVGRDDLEAFMGAPASEAGKQSYERRLSRLIINALYSLGLRRAELIDMTIGNVDFGRKVVKIRGKGDKMREIPLVDTLSQEILLYLEAVEALCGGKRSLNEPLFVTYRGSKLYPVFVDRVVKRELGGVKDITGRRSPHVLRHSIATELLDKGTDLNSIKEMLGHSNLAVTQVYTHSSVARLKDIYKQAHPRAKNGGKHGD